MRNCFIKHLGIFGISELVEKSLVCRVVFKFLSILASILEIMVRLLASVQEKNNDYPILTGNEFQIQ